jgi:hypothetical protein
MMADRIVPHCARRDASGASHHCAHLCPHAPGAACRPPAGSWWRASEGPARRYKILRDALPANVELTEQQERYMRWLASMDDETCATVASLVQLAAVGPREVLGVDKTAVAVGEVLDVDKTRDGAAGELARALREGSAVHVRFSRDAHGVVKARAYGHSPDAPTLASGRVLANELYALATLALDGAK